MTWRQKSNKTRELVRKHVHPHVKSDKEEERSLVWEQFEMQVWAVHEFCVGYVPVFQVEVPSNWMQRHIDLEGERFDLRLTC